MVNASGIDEFNYCGHCNNRHNGVIYRIDRYHPFKAVKLSI